MPFRKPRLALIVLTALPLCQMINSGAAMPSPPDSACNEDDRQKIDDTVAAVFPNRQGNPKVISCRQGSTAFASFSHISAEVTPASISTFGDFQPVGDPAWIPMNLMAKEYAKSFENADWQKVTFAGAFDAKTGVRIFLINAQDGKSFILITSE